jgi:HD-like signal output (HDOD) protein
MVDVVSETIAHDRASLGERVRATLTRLSRSGELPTLPHSASAALQRASDPDADVDDVCALIETDVGLAACVLRHANAVTTGRRKPATTLPTAVMTIGLGNTCQILVAACARRMYSGVGHNAEWLWKHALAVGIAAQALAKVTRLTDPNAAFLPGLFHDVGRVAFLLADPTSFEVIGRLAEGSEGRRTALEAEWYGFDHAEASSVLVEGWGLAPEQCEAIRSHHNPARATTSVSLARILGAADALAHVLQRTAGATDSPATTLETLGLDAETQAACMERVRERLEEQLALLG